MKTNTLILLFISLEMFSQVNSKLRPWNIGCETMQTQTELNMCSFESFTIVDSILNLEYIKLVKTLELKYIEAVKDKEDAEYISNIKNQKLSVERSQMKFLEFREEIADIIRYQYYGGTISPLMTNSYKIKLTENQLNILIDLNKEIE